MNYSLENIWQKVLG